MFNHWYSWVALLTLVAVVYFVKRRGAAKALADVKTAVAESDAAIAATKAAVEKKTP